MLGDSNHCTHQQVFDQDAQAMLSHSRRKIGLEDWIWSILALTKRFSWPVQTWPYRFPPLESSL